jgi:hypothetical protein
VVAGYQVIYPFTPFGRPVSMPPVFTPRTAGATAPLKFGLGGNYGLNVLASGSPTSQQVSCTTAAAIGAVAATAGTLTYDTTSQQYTYSWKTDKTWKGTCRQFTLKLDDGKAYPVLFSF